MASVFGYATIANVEAFSGIDYSTVNTVAFADANVEYKISMAEYLINAHFGTSSGVTITNGVTMATVMIAAKLLDSNMAHLGYHGEDGHTANDLIGMSIHDILTHFLDETQDDFVEAIPMTGANYYKADLRY